MIQLTLTLKMTTAQVVETSVTVKNSPIQDFVHPNDQAQPTYEMTTRFKPFTAKIISCLQKRVKRAQIMASPHYALSELVTISN